MSLLHEILVGGVLLLAAVFALAAAAGVARFPDFYTRTHAASKAGTLSAMLCLVAVAIAALDWALTLRVLVGVLFFLFTAPVSAHLLARAAWISGHRPAPGTKTSALDERFEPKGE